jgi:hypothetical protein
MAMLIEAIPGQAEYAVAGPSLQDAGAERSV